MLNVLHSFFILENLKMYIFGIFGGGGCKMIDTPLRCQGERCPLQFDTLLARPYDIYVAYNFNYYYTHVKTQLDDGVPQE